MDQKTNHIFRALKYPNYRLYFIGQGVSLVGSWMQAMAMSWLVYRLTHSAFLLGVIGFSSQIPSFFLAPVSGILADRHDKRRLMMTIQTLFMAQALVLTVLVLFRIVAVWQLIGLGVFMGLANALDMPVRQSFVVELVPNPEDLGNAIALNSMMFNAARLIGPSLAGILITGVGEGFCFLLNTLSYLAVLIALFLMKLDRRPVLKIKPRLREELRLGIRYVFGFHPLRNIILLISLVSLMGMSFHVLMPVFAKEILSGGPHTLGFLMGALGVGAILGAFYLASRKTVWGLEKNIPVAAFLFGSGLIGVSLSRNLAVSLFLMTVTGFGMMVFMISSNTLLQNIADDDKRGKVMSFYTVAFMGMTPIGSLLSGSLASSIGTPVTVAAGGSACIIGAVLFYRGLHALRRKIHPIFVKKGILPEVVRGMESVAEMTAPPE
ncbi:MFS transporter [bacterium]|nr:MFS transporter [bacterium]